MTITAPGDMMDPQIAGWTLARLRTRPDPTALLTPSGRVTFLNPAARRSLGPLAAPGRGTDWWEFWDPSERLRRAGAVRDAAGGRAVRLGARPAAGGPDWDLVILPAEEGGPTGRPAVTLLAALARPPQAAAPPAPPVPA
ncbi:MAG: PAS domain-containing protein [Hasllibacter sp.]